MPRNVYIIDNLDCANCAAKIEKKFNDHKDVQEAIITFSTKQLRLTAEDPDALIPELIQIARTVEGEVEIYPRDGKRPVRRNIDRHHHEHHDHDHECGCGHHHEHHDHDHECGCGHHHEHHDHDHECGCGHHHEHHDHDHECNCAHHHEHHDHDHECGCGHHHEHHDHDHECGCGHHHEHHDHDQECGCGHHHEHHDHDHECGCGHHHEHQEHGHNHEEHSHDHDHGKQEPAILLLGTAMLLIGLRYHDTGAAWFAFLACLLGYFLLGKDVVKTALRNLTKGHVFDENFLMSIATIGAFFIGEYPEAVGVMLFYRVG